MFRKGRGGLYKPQQRKREEIERLRGEGDPINHEMKVHLCLIVKLIGQMKTKQTIDVICNYIHFQQ